MAIFTSSRSPAPARPLAKVTAPRATKADKIRRAEDALEKLGDVRAAVPVRKIADGSAALLDKAIVGLSEYLDIVKAAGK